MSSLHGVVSSLIDLAIAKYNFRLSEYEKDSGTIKDKELALKLSNILFFSVNNDVDFNVINIDKLMPQIVGRNVTNGSVTGPRLCPRSPDTTGILGRENVTEEPIASASSSSNATKIDEINQTSSPTDRDDEEIYSSKQSEDDDHVGDDMDYSDVETIGDNDAATYTNGDKPTTRHDSGTSRASDDYSPGKRPARPTVSTSTAFVATEHGEIYAMSPEDLTTFKLRKVTETNDTHTTIPEGAEQNTTKHVSKSRLEKNTGVEVRASKPGDQQGISTSKPNGVVSPKPFYMFADGGGSNRAECSSADELPLVPRQEDITAQASNSNSQAVSLSDSDKGGENIIELSPRPSPHLEESLNGVEKLDDTPVVSDTNTVGFSTPQTEAGPKVAKLKLTKKSNSTNFSSKLTDNKEKTSPSKKVHNQSVSTPSSNVRVLTTDEDDMDEIDDLSDSSIKFSDNDDVELEPESHANSIGDATGQVKVMSNDPKLNKTLKVVVNDMTADMLAIVGDQDKLDELIKLCREGDKKMKEQLVGQDHVSMCKNFVKSADGKKIREKKSKKPFSFSSSSSSSDSSGSSSASDFLSRRRRHTSTVNLPKIPNGALNIDSSSSDEKESSGSDFATRKRKTKRKVSSSGDDGSSRKKIIKRVRKKSDSEFELSDDSPVESIQDSDVECLVLSSGSDEFDEWSEPKATGNKGPRNKVNNLKPSSSLKTSLKSSQVGTSSVRSGRRKKTRKILEDTDLQPETQSAAQAEKERMARLDERRRLLATETKATDEPVPVPVPGPSPSTRYKPPRTVEPTSSTPSAKVLNFEQPGTSAQRTLGTRVRIPSTSTKKPSPVSSSPARPARSVPSEVLPEGKRVVLDSDIKTKEVLVGVHSRLATNLKDHQVDGIKFMYDSTIESLDKANSSGSGCILAHSMGLGKTLQIVAFLHTVFTNQTLKQHFRTALVVAPINASKCWTTEFNMWLLEKGLCDFTCRDLGDIKTHNQRQDLIRMWHSRGGVLIVGHTAFTNMVNASNDTSEKSKHSDAYKKIIRECIVDPGADIVVVDEGHYIKNHQSLLNIALNQVRTMRRIILTGTPLQNNLEEYHTMVSFVKPNLLGTLKEFRNRFVLPIKDGQHQDSTEPEVRIMKKRAHVLHKLLEGSVQRRDHSILMPFLQPKHEYTIMVQLTDIQIELYQKYLDTFTSGCEDKKSGLFANCAILRLICAHPNLLYDMADRARNRDLIGEEEVLSGDEDNGHKKKSKKKLKPEDLERAKALGDVTWFNSKIPDRYAMDISLSGKFALMFEILNECERVGDKVVIFSLSLDVLGFIERMLKTVGDNKNALGQLLDPELRNTWDFDFDYFRIDGSKSAEQRKVSVDKFNSVGNPRARLFLLSTKAGAVGINLIGANRCIIFDVSWNPSDDMQSIGRIYRFGQLKQSYIYRFVSKGTMEEKIYERQIIKGSLAARVVDKQQIERHFTKNGLMLLYKFEPKMDNPPVPVIPDDTLLANLMVGSKTKEYILDYHKPDSLLLDKPEEHLTEEERRAAWEEYEIEKTNKIPEPVPNQAEVNGDVQQPSEPMDTTEANYQQIQSATNNEVPGDNRADGTMTYEMLVTQQREAYEQARRPNMGMLGLPGRLFAQGKAFLSNNISPGK